MNAAFFLVLAGALASVSPIYGQRPTPLSELIAEAQRNNAGLHAAEHAWRAAATVSKQVTALPDPQFTLQEFSIGSPKPSAGFDTSNFAYLGIGASQELPYPGKLRLKGQAADAAASVEPARAGALEASIAEQVKTVYISVSLICGGRSNLSKAAGPF